MSSAEKRHQTREEAAGGAVVPRNVPRNVIVQGDALEVLQTWPSESVHCVVTSPPYWSLRDYGVAGAIGLEASLDEWVAALVAVLREVRRVLRPDGTLWLNLGDSYLPDKQLAGQPWRVAFALQADGWWLRSDIVWHKPNPMPESVTDRPTKAHEYLFLLTKQPTYYYDAEAVREPAEYGRSEHSAEWKPWGHQQEGERVHGRATPGDGNGGRNKRDVWTIPTRAYAGAHFATFPPTLVEPCVLAGAAPRVCEQCDAPWRRVVVAEGGTIGHSWHDHTNDTGVGQRVTDPNGKGNSRSDYRRESTGWQPTCRCVGAIGSGRAVVLDPFAGTATACYVAKALGRSYVGIELNPQYVRLAEQRLARIPHTLWPAEHVTGGVADGPSQSDEGGGQ